MIPPEHGGQPGDPYPTHEEIHEAARLGVTVVELRRLRGVEDAPWLRAVEARKEIRNWQEEERGVRNVFIAICGAPNVYSRSQRRPGKVTPGPTDLEVFLPAPVSRSLRWETKHGDGRLTRAQEEYRDNVRRCGELWGCGGKRDAEEMLISLGLATRGARGELNPIRKAS